MTTQAKHQRRTTMVPVTTMEELPVLDGKERGELLDTLKRSEDEVAAGKALGYEPKRFVERLLRIYRGKKR
jgi:hypothetical protein